MKTLLDSYSGLWPAESLEKLRGLLQSINVLHYPSEAHLIPECKNPKNVIVVVEAAPLHEVLDLFSKGFLQFVQKDRKDFAEEILIAALMISKPTAFVKDPISFFLASFTKGAATKSETEENQILIPFSSNLEKATVLDKLNFFLMQENKLISVKDLCLQIVDEMFMNAMFSAPVDTRNHHYYQNTDRATNVAYSEGRKGKVFSCFSPQRVILSCIDPFGSWSFDQLALHLKKAFTGDSTSPRAGSGGAGLGLRYMIESSSIFYVFIKPKEYAFVACGLELKGLKSNLSEKKNFHFMQL